MLCVHVSLCVMYLKSPWVSEFKYDWTCVHMILPGIRLCFPQSCFLCVVLILRFSLREGKYSLDLHSFRLAKSVGGECLYLWNSSRSSRADVCWL